MSNDIIKQEDKQTTNRSELSIMRIISIGMLVIFVYLSTMLITNHFTIKKYSAEKAAVTQKLETAQKEIKDLEQYIENAKDPEFVEKVARENLKMVRPDEKVYIVMK